MSAVAANPDLMDMARNPKVSDEQVIGLFLTAVNAADAVGHGNDRTLIADLGGVAESLDPALDQFADFRRVELHVRTPK
jgi:hypothetical protein